MDKDGWKKPGECRGGERFGFGIFAQGSSLPRGMLRLPFWLGVAPDVNEMQRKQKERRLFVSISHFFRSK